MNIGYQNALVLPCLYSHELTQNNDGATPKEKLQTYTNAIQEQTGIVHKHLLPIQCLAKDLNCIISIRPVDKLATELIELGYPTKGLHIKGKSASWGPQAGFICEEQKFSKLENASHERIDKFNQQVQQCILDKYAVPIELVIPQKRLNTLLEKGVIEDLILENGDIYSFRAKGPSEKYYSFTARKLLNYDGEDYEISYNNEPLKVLAPIKNALPFTADYDLLLVAPHISDFGPQDNLSIPDVSHCVFCRRMSSYHDIFSISHELIQSYHIANIFYQNEHPEIGNTSERINHLIDLINEKLVGQGGKVVHHSVDCANPSTDLLTNYPATFALPTKIGPFDEICVIKDNDELKELITEAKSAGYVIKTNPLWGDEFSKIHSRSFDYAKHQLMLKLKSTNI